MKYLIAVDSSENSHYAFSQAKKRFFTQKDHVYILTVTESPTAYPFEDLLNFSTESYNEMNRKIEQMYAELLKKYGRKLTRSSIPHTCLLARGTIKDVICRQAQDLCVDVVIMGRRGLGKLERTFIGSTSQYCVHNLNCSVMVIPYIEQEKTLEKQPEELATEISSKEEEEVSGKEFKKGSKFEKIGQYEKEKWQQKEIKSEEFEGDHPTLPFDDKMLKEQKKNLKHEEFEEENLKDRPAVPFDDKMLKEQKKHLKHEEFEGDHPTLPFDDKMLKEQKKHLKHEEFEEENLKDRPAVPFDDKMLKEQKKNLKHEEFEEENLKDRPAVPFDDKMLKEQKEHLKHEEGTIDVIEEQKVDEPTKNVAKESTKKKRKNKKKKNNNNNKGNVGKSVGKWEDVTKESSKGSGKVSEKDLPPPLPIESLPHDISSEPITGDLLEKQKNKLKHEEGSIDVIEEKKELEGNIKGKGKEKGKKNEGKFEKKQKETNVGSANISGKGKSQKGSEKGGEGGKWIAKDVSGTKEELKQEGGAGKFHQVKEPITSSPPIQKSSQEKKECNDPLCNNSECEKHGVKSKEHGPKWQGKVHEKKECNDPLCSNPNCAKHGKLAKEKEKEKNVWKESGKEAGKEGGKEGVVPSGGKSFAEVVSSSQGEEKGKGVGNSPQIVQKSEHKAAINIGEGKIEGKFGSSNDEEGKWKGSVEIGFKGKDEKGHEKQGKSLEASVQSK